jgi:hypothetical protein
VHQRVADVHSLSLVVRDRCCPQQPCHGLAACHTSKSCQGQSTTPDRGSSYNYLSTPLKMQGRGPDYHHGLQTNPLTHSPSCGGATFPRARSDGGVTTICLRPTCEAAAVLLEVPCAVFHLNAMRHPVCQICQILHVS